MENDKKLQLKVNPGNTINIKPIKDSWNREELLQYIKLAFEAGEKCQYDMCYETSWKTYKKQTEENL